MTIQAWREFVQKADEWAWANHAKYTYRSPYFKYSGGIIGRSLKAADLKLTHLYAARFFQKVQETPLNKAYEQR